MELSYTVEIGCAVGRHVQYWCVVEHGAVEQGRVIADRVPTHADAARIADALNGPSMGLQTAFATLLGFHEQTQVKTSGRSGDPVIAVDARIPLPMHRASGTLACYRLLGDPVITTTHHPHMPPLSSEFGMTIEAKIGEARA